MIHNRDNHVYLPTAIEVTVLKDSPPWCNGVKINIYDTLKMKNVFDLDNREHLTSIYIDNFNPIISQSGLAVIPIADPEDGIESLSSETHSCKKFNIIPKNITYPFNLYDVKFPYEIALNTIDQITGEKKPLTIRGPGVAPVYFALIYSQKGLLPSDCVPDGTKEAPAGFSRTIVNNEEDLYYVYGRFVHYALGGNEKEAVMKFTPVKDEEDIVHGYTTSINEKRCIEKNCPNFDEDKINKVMLDEYKGFVDHFLTQKPISRVFATEGDSKEILFNLYKNVWRPGRPDEVYKNDAMYKAMLNTTIMPKV